LPALGAEQAERLGGVVGQVELLGGRCGIGNPERKGGEQDGRRDEQGVLPTPA
jgi:hypothetical protein